MSSSNSSVPPTTEEGSEDVEMLSESIPSKSPRKRKLKYNGWMIGKPLKETITIRVKSSGQVDDMITAVHKDTGSIHRRVDIIIWKVSIPYKDMKASLGHIRKPKDISGAEQLSSLQYVSEEFAEPNPRLIQFVVEIKERVPSRVPLGVKRKRGSMSLPDSLLSARQKAVSYAEAAPSPSSASKPVHFINEQTKRPVYNGRFNLQGDDLRVGAPVTLYHRVFSQFQEDLQVSLDSMELDTQYLSDVNTLCGQSSALYLTEAERERHVMKTLGTVLGFFFKTRTTDLGNKENTKSDGVVSIECGSDLETAFIFILELKNEIGVGGCDPAIQALQSYRKYWLGSPRLRDNSCCPSFLIAIAGPWMSVHGAILVGDVISQRLTENIWIGADPFQEDQISRVARLCKALSRAARELIEFYQIPSLQPSPSQSFQSSQMADAPFEGPQVSHLFPYINSYSINGNEVRFKYLQRLKPERTSSVFKAQVLDDSKFIVVKFVRRYNEEAHALLANFNLAPQLYYVEPEPQQSFATGQILVRRPRMIVMEYVDGDSPRDAFYHEKPPQNFFDDINEAIEKLHQKDLVFGDLRGPNIIVGERGNVKLIDFDWCGEAGKARYPPDLNDSSTIGWHPGVKKQGLMEKEHDVWMQDVLNGYAPLD